MGKITNNSGGEGGIRTHGTVTRTTVFETVVQAPDWYGRQFQFWVVAGLHDAFC